RAPRLLAMQAIREAAVLRQRAEAWIQPREVRRLDAADGELADAGAVHDPAAARERQQRHVGGRVAAAAVVVGDVAGGEAEAGAHGVEQARLAHARVADEQADALAHQRGERGDALSGATAGLDDLDAELAVGGDDAARALGLADRRAAGRAPGRPLQ